MSFKTLLLSIFSALLATSAFAQYKTVVFNYDQSYFNQGQALPAESKLMLTGDAASDVQMVEVLVYGSYNVDKDALYGATWKRSESNTTNSFSLPLNYPLRGNENYTFLINYYKPASETQQQQLLKQVNDGLAAYIDQSISINGNRMKFRNNPRSMVSDMDRIVSNGMFYYRNRINYNFSGFSDLVKEKLLQLRGLRLSTAKYNVPQNGGSETEQRMTYAQQQVEALKTMVYQELSQYANSNLLMVSDTKTIVDYQTEKTRNVIAVNVGYAGVYNEGDFDNFSSGNAPFIGLSLPLGNKAFSAPFWARSSISAGVFLQKIKFSENNTATGPIIDRPIYLALGYRALPFVRINAGATVLQSDKEKNGIGDLNLDKMYIRPFIGLSIEFNLWLGLNK